MRGPVGALPQPLVRLDDTLFDAQCSADAQTANTASMLDAFGRIWEDGRIDDQDAADLCYLRRHTLLEHELNREQCSLLRWCRRATDGTGRVIQGLRGRLQEMRRATREVALQMPCKAPAQLNGNGR